MGYRQSYTILLNYVRIYNLHAASIFTAFWKKTLRFLGINIGIGLAVEGR